MNQAAHRDTAADFDSFMSDCMEREWAAEKSALATGLGTSLGAFAGVPQGGASHFSASPAATAPQPPPLLPFGQAGSAAYDASARLEAYAPVLPALNDARRRGVPYDAAEAFRAALMAGSSSGGAGAGGDGAPGSAGASLPEFWRAVACVLRGAQRGEAGMVQGALGYLQSGHAAFMRAVCARDPTRAQLGGSVATQALLHAFLRIKLRDAGTLDFDAEGGASGASVDTAWPCAYYAARSGFAADAAAAASRARGAPDLAPVLAAWAAADGAPPPPAAAAVAAEEAERALREPPGRPGRAHRAALAAMLSGDGSLADAVQSAFPELFTTIEDFLWFRLATVRAAAAAPTGGAPPLSPLLRGPASGESSPGGTGAGGYYSLAELQSYLSRFPASHYAKGGREPLLAATVLVLSLRLGGACSFLAGDALAEGHAVDGAHLACALACAPPAALQQLGQEQAQDKAGACGGLLLALGRQLAGPAPARAAEYLALAAASLAASARASPGASHAASPSPSGEEAAVAAALLRELLRHQGAPAALLDGQPPQLARFQPDDARRAALVEQAAVECEAAGLFEQALELHARAGSPARALALLNRRIGELLAGGGGGGGGGGADGASSAVLSAVLARGQPLAAAAAAAGERFESGSFAQLRALAQLLGCARSGRHGEVLSLLRSSAELSFFPLDPGRADRCAQQLDALHPALLARLPDLLLAAAHALHAPAAAQALGETARRAALQALAAFTLAARFRLAPQVYADLARLAPIA